MDETSVLKKEIYVLNVFLYTGYEYILLGTDISTHAYNTTMLTTVLKEFFIEYNINVKYIQAIITDGAAVMSSTIRTIKKDLKFHCDHIFCVAHSLNLLSVYAFSSNKDIHLFLYDFKDFSNIPKV